jgi:hypothetical protein
MIHRCSNGSNLCNCYVAKSLGSAQALLTVLSMRPHNENGHILPTTGVISPPTIWIIRITGGNFRLLHRLITQIARLVEINALHTVTCQVVDAARESLVIGTA